MSTSGLTITTERIDDVVLLIELMKQIDLPNVLDRHLPRHWLEEGLSWGWVTTIWLAHILSQGDHRKLTVRDWVRQGHTTLEHATSRSIRETDFTDDRLTIDLRQVKLMMGALDPLGLPLGTDVVSGERAEDGLYVPIIDRIVTT